MCSSPQSFFAERFFTLFDADGSGTISLEELLKALSLLVHGDEMDKLRFLFQVYDVDGKMVENRLICIFSLNQVVMSRQCGFPLSTQAPASPFGFGAGGTSPLALSTAGDRVGGSLLLDLHQG